MTQSRFCGVAVPEELAKDFQYASRLLNPESHNPYSIAFKEAIEIWLEFTREFEREESTPMRYRQGETKTLGLSLPPEIYSEFRRRVAKLGRHPIGGLSICYSEALNLWLERTRSQRQMKELTESVVEMGYKKVRSSKIEKGEGFAIIEDVKE